MCRSPRPISSAKMPLMPCEQISYIHVSPSSWYSLIVPPTMHFGWAAICRLCSPSFLPSRLLPTRPKTCVLLVRISLKAALFCSNSSSSLALASRSDFVSAFFFFRCLIRAARRFSSNALLEDRALASSLMMSSSTSPTSF